MLTVTWIQWILAISTAAYPRYAVCESILCCYPARWPQMQISPAHIYGTINYSFLIIYASRAIFLTFIIQNCVFVRNELVIVHFRNYSDINHRIDNVAHYTSLCIIVTGARSYCYFPITPPSVQEWERG